MPDQTVVLTTTLFGIPGKFWRRQPFFKKAKEDPLPEPTTPVEVSVQLSC